MPSWLSPRAFLVSALATAAATYPQAAKLGFSNGAIAEWIVATVVGGFVWGVAITFAIKRWFSKQAAPASQLQISNEDSRARRFRLIGYLLLGAALSIPIVLGVSSVLSAFDAGRKIGQMGMAYLLAAAVGWAAFRKRSNVSKAYVTLAVGIAFLAWSLFAGFATWRDGEQIRLDKRQAVFAELALQLSNKHKAENLVLTQKIAALDFDNVLHPTRITTANGIAESRKTLRIYSDLLVERRSLLKAQAERFELFMRTADVSERDRESAIASMNTSNVRNKALVLALDSAQEGSIKALSALLDFAQVNLGKTVAKNGQVLFSSQNQLDRFRELMAVLQKYANDEERVMMDLSKRQDEIESSRQRIRGVIESNSK